MSKVVNWNNFNKGFDESFIAAYQLQQKLNQQRDERVQDIKFKMRELSLLDDYRNEALKQDQSQFDKALEVEAPRREAMTKYYEHLANPQPELLEPIKGSELIPKYEGSLEQEYEVDPYTGEKRITGYGSLYRPYESSMNQSGSGSQSGLIDEKPLQQWQVQQGLNYLQNPPISETKDDKERVYGTKELTANLDSAVNNLASGYLDSSTRLWLSGLQKQYGRYPNPDELKKEIVESGKAGELTEEQGQQLNSFLNVYYQSYGGVNKLQRRIINPESYKIE